MLYRTEDLNTFAGIGSSKGVYYKWKDSNYYYKTGTLFFGEFSPLEPVTECICSDIGNLLNVNNIQYDLVKVHTKGNSDFEEQDILVCRSLNFLNDNEEQFITMRKHYNRKVDYDTIIDDFPNFKELLNQMLIFDFIVNNIDRHYNNFGYIKNIKTNKVRFAPIFDNGLSLYSMLDIETLKTLKTKPFNKKKYDKAKPFMNKHYSQIKLIKELPQINLDFNDSDIEKILLKYKNVISKTRIEMIFDLVKERLHYVRQIYTNV
ncbi:hypothetical protein [Clostridioides difficile]|uniref:hypothetical protein n=1 Tax=Clostridioides difficile TaxID=1496 RepID=UPI0003B284AF|nr:hypothetical protein [Clostridioides difficile]EJA6785387.1 hypothetical protein [Clostridioides difficile]CCL55240.1 conserved hypothetical protein [Clostridioides difficile E14]HBG3855162.1 hypothetical protein [Clostridioides difficile]HBG4348046.1 hypothetical protein [Clostridioides difficile]HBL8524155.1 hypothetical protein [Clostridioides difficile]